MAWLEERNSRRHMAEDWSLGRMVAQELVEYRQLLDQERARTLWTAAELDALQAIVGGAVITGHPLRYLVEDYLDQGAAGEHWGVDEDALRQKVAGLGPTAAAATLQALSASLTQETSSWREHGFTLTPPDHRGLT